jgi:hypothetical protein
MKNMWRADPLVWGHGPRVFEVFLEPTCPFSVKAFGKLDDLLALQRARRKFVIRRLQSWRHTTSGVASSSHPSRLASRPLMPLTFVGRDPHRIAQMPDMQEARRPAGQVQRRVTMTVWNTSISLLLSAGGRRPTEIQKEGRHE